jgi:hypothetical protein
MSNIARTLCPALFLMALAGCGSGGGDPTRNTFVEVEFTSFQAVRSGQGRQEVHMTGSSQTVTGTLDGSGNVNSIGVGTIDSSGSTLTLTYPPPDSTGAVDLTKPMVDIRTPSTTLSSTGMFGTTCASSLCVVTPAGIASPTFVLADSTSLGWNYQTFGVWSQETSASSFQFGAISAGAATPGGSIPTVGNPTFTGIAAGSYVDATGARFGTSANMSAVVDFGAHSIAFSTTNTVTMPFGVTGTTTGAPNLNLSGTLTYTAGTNQFAGGVATPGNTLTGTANGRFFGPAAEEIGGLYSAAGGGATMTGAFGGKR